MGSNCFKLNCTVVNHVSDRSFAPHSCTVFKLCYRRRNLDDSQGQNIAKMPPNCLSVTTVSPKISSDTMPSAQESTSAPGKKKKDSSSQLENWIDVSWEARDWLSLNARWVVSCTPSHSYCHGNAPCLCLFITGWSYRVACIDVLTLSLSAVPVLPQFKPLNPDLFF